MQTYLVRKNFRDPDYTPPLKFKEGDIVDLDDATENHVNRKQTGTLAIYAVERAQAAAPHDRMLHGATNRAMPDDRQGGANDQGSITRSNFKAVVNKK